jgi:adenine/guanine phosphoribosyltransferase-like PRPP-binding protein
LLNYSDHLNTFQELELISSELESMVEAIASRGQDGVVSIRNQKALCGLAACKGFFAV